MQGPALRVVEPGPAGTLPEGRPQPVPGPQPVPAGDRRAPRLTVVSAKRRAGRVTLTVRCDEACRVSGKAGRKTVRRSLRANADGRLVLRGRRVVLTATDAAGNVTRRTVKR